MVNNTNNYQDPWSRIGQKRSREEDESDNANKRQRADTYPPTPSNGGHPPQPLPIDIWNRLPPPSSAQPIRPLPPSPSHGRGPIPGLGIYRMPNRGGGRPSLPDPHVQPGHICPYGGSVQAQNGRLG